MQIRCSRESPACARCMHQYRHCQYPDPPNRRLLASLRGNHPTPAAADQRRSAQYLTGSLDVSGIEIEFPSMSPVVAQLELPEPFDFLDDGPQLEGLDRSIDTGQNNSFCPPRLALCIEAPSTRKMPSQEIGILLIEVYFTRFFDARLLYDQDSVTRSYRCGVLPRHTALSIFAFASL